jgi:hypothetical protein
MVLRIPKRTVEEMLGNGGTRMSKHNNFIGGS